LPFWTGACLSLPPVIYGIVAMGGNLNIGLRHILPVYPFIYIAVGIAFARVLSWRPKVATTAMVLVGLGLAAESLTSWPNYLPFFNVASGGSRGGIRLLGDSNLDWGQDLKALGAWQRAHKDRPLYLSNFGVVPPEYYEIDCSYLMGAAKSLKRVHLWEIRRDQPAYLAVFASNLQPIYIDKQEFAALREATPREVLNGTIYLYDWPLPASSTTQP
jgi:hypothetical protein